MHRIWNRCHDQRGRDPCSLYLNHVCSSGSRFFRASGIHTSIKSAAHRRGGKFTVFIGFCGSDRGAEPDLSEGDPGEHRLGLRDVPDSAGRSPAGNADSAVRPDRQLAAMEFSEYRSERGIWQHADGCPLDASGRISERNDRRRGWDPSVQRGWNLGDSQERYFLIEKQGDGRGV